MTAEINLTDDLFIADRAVQTVLSAAHVRSLSNR
jgi:hypothetical protein